MVSFCFSWQIETVSFFVFSIFFYFYSKSETYNTLGYCPYFLLFYDIILAYNLQKVNKVLLRKNWVFYPVFINTLILYSEVLVPSVPSAGSHESTVPQYGNKVLQQLSLVVLHTLPKVTFISSPI